MRIITACLLLIFIFECLFIQYIETTTVFETRLFSDYRFLSIIPYFEVPGSFEWSVMPVFTVKNNIAYKIISDMFFLTVSILVAWIVMLFLRNIKKYIISMLVIDLLFILVIWNSPLYFVNLIVRCGAPNYVLGKIDERYLSLGRVDRNWIDTPICNIFREIFEKTAPSITDYSYSVAIATIMYFTIQLLLISVLVIGLYKITDRKSYSINRSTHLK